MEGPRIPMQPIELMIAVAPVDLLTPLKAFIGSKYGEDPAEYHDAIEEFNNLRESACRVAGDIKGVMTLKKYFGQLTMLASRFPMQSGEECAVPFCWCEKFGDLTNCITLDDIGLELACIMHNVGALHAHIGASETRKTEESMKAACTHFQCAAGAFTYLRDKMKASVFSAEFDSNLLNYYYYLMLAQAQECIVEKSVADGRPTVVVCKLCVQVAQYYQSCIQCLSDKSVLSIAGNTRCNVWKNSALAKFHLYTSISNFHCGMQADEQSLMGTRLAWYKMAGENMKQSMKLGEKQSNEYKEALQYTNDLVNAKLEKAQKENDFIYHELIPSEETLARVQGASLVKGVMFDPLDVQISGPDIFGKLVPLRVHQANSMFSEEKDKLLRHVMDKVEISNDKLSLLMESLNLGELQLEADPGDSPLPDILLERSAKFNADPQALPKLLDSLQRLTSCYQEADKKVNDLKDRVNLLRADANKMMECPNLPNKSIQTLESASNGVKQLDEGVSAVVKSMQMAAENDKELNRAVAINSTNFNMLALQLNELKKRLPAPKQKPVDTAEGSELKKMLDKVEEMKSQREILVDQMRHQLQGDDLTKRLIADKTSELGELFTNALMKHEEKIKYIQQNLVAQENILEAVTNANANYAEKRKEFIDILTKREALIFSLIAAFDIYEDVLAKTDKGRVFYSNLFTSLEAIEDELERAENDWPVLKAQMQNNVQSVAESVNVDPPLQSPHPPNLSIPSPGTQSKTDRSKNGRPRLADYMEYYRNKKSGQNNSNATASQISPQMQPQTQPQIQTNVQPQVQMPQIQSQAQSQMQPQIQSPIQTPNMASGVFVTPASSHPPHVPQSVTTAAHSHIMYPYDTSSSIQYTQLHSQQQQQQNQPPLQSVAQPMHSLNHPQYIPSVAHDNRGRVGHVQPQVAAPSPAQSGQISGTFHAQVHAQQPPNHQHQYVSPQPQINTIVPTSNQEYQTGMQPATSQQSVPFFPQQSPVSNAGQPYRTTQQGSYPRQGSPVPNPQFQPQLPKAPGHIYPPQSSVNTNVLPSQSSHLDPQSFVPQQRMNNPQPHSGVSLQSQMPQTQIQYAGAVNQRLYQPQQTNNVVPLHLHGQQSYSPQQQTQPISQIQQGYTQQMPQPQAIGQQTTPGYQMQSQQIGQPTPGLQMRQSTQAYANPQPAPYKSQPTFVHNQASQFDQSRVAQPTHQTYSQQIMHPQPQPQANNPPQQPIKQKTYVLPSGIMDAKVGGANLPAPLLPTVVVKDISKCAPAPIPAQTASHFQDLQGIVLTSQQTQNVKHIVPENSDSSLNATNNTHVSSHSSVSNGLSPSITTYVNGDGNLHVHPVPQKTCHPIQDLSVNANVNPVTQIPSPTTKIDASGESFAPVKEEVAANAIEVVDSNVCVLSVTDLVDPSKFTLGEGDKSKPRCQKDEFVSPKKYTPDENDPFKDLDPLRR